MTPTPTTDDLGSGHRIDPGLTYGEAIDELEDLLDELEGADVDVDVLAHRVARGVELIRFCRARLDVVTGDVDAVVAELVEIQSDHNDDQDSDDQDGDNQDGDNQDGDDQDRGDVP